MVTYMKFLQRLNKKYEISFRNSSWVFTVWDNEDIIAMVRGVADKGFIKIRLEGHR